MKCIFFSPWNIASCITISCLLNLWKTNFRFRFDNGDGWGFISRIPWVLVERLHCWQKCILMSPGMVDDAGQTDKAQRTLPDPSRAQARHLPGPCPLPKQWSSGEPLRLMLLQYHEFHIIVLDTCQITIRQTKWIL